MISFIKGGTRLPIGRMTRDCLITHRICLHQCAPNLFRVFGSVDALNEQMELGLTLRDVVWMYKCYLLIDSSHYLKSRSFDVRLISCLPKSNKGMKDDFLTISGEWHGFAFLFFSFLFTFFFFFPDKRYVTLNPNFVNIPDLNKLLRSEVFVSKDRQLRVVHLILDFKPLFDKFQDVGNAIRAGDPQLARIDIWCPDS